MMSSQWVTTTLTSLLRGGGCVRRLSVIAPCLSLCMIGFSSADDAHASVRKETSIPAEGLGPALNALAKDRNFQIVYVTEEIANVHTDGAIGEFTTDEALKRLLIGTGLTYHYLDEKTITIGSASLPQLRNSSTSNATSSGSLDQSNSTQEAKKSTSDGFRVAQVDQGKNTGSPQGGYGVAGGPSNAAAEKQGSLEEILVTAQKREERLIDVPISVAVVTSDELDKRKITSIDDLMFAVPDLAVSNLGGNAREFSIRGVFNFAGTSPSIGVYIDEADMSGNSMFQADPGIYDLDRVEVLRGPQGTLYGEGSTGGTIRFITKDPVLDKFQFDSDVAAMFTQGGAPSQRIQEVVNIPLIENTLAIRIAGSFDHEGGWIDEPAAGQTDINQQNQTNVRVKVLWKPSDQLTLNAMAMIHRNDMVPDVYENPSGNFNQAADTDYTPAFNLTTTPRLQDNYNLYNLTLSYDFVWARILSTTTYFEQSVDAENYTEFFQAAAPPASPINFYYPDWDINSDDLTQEVRLTSAGSGPWQWTVGGYFKDLNGLSSAKTDYMYYSGPPGPLPNSALFSQFTDPPDDSVSVFGDTHYKFFDRLTLGAGVRYYHDRIGTGYSACCAVDGALAPDPTASFHSVDPRFYADYKVSDEINVYTSAAKGFRSGGVNSFINGVAEPPYSPESLWAYELGTKTSLLDGRLSADAALFYSNYTNYQVVGISRPSIVDFTQNGGDAWLKGVEWDLTWHPVDAWTLRFNGNVLKTRFYKISVTDDAYSVGDQIGYAPNHTLVVSVQRDFVWNGRQGFTRLDYSQIGPETYTERAVGAYYFGETKDINMLNFNSGLQLNDNLSLGVFAQNLLNNQDFTNPDYLEHAGKPRPRTYGINFSVKFD